MNKYRHAAVVIGSSLALGAGIFAGTAFAGGGNCGGEGKGAHGPAQRFNDIDTNKDGKVTLAELTASRESWLARVDTNKDGVASSEELKAGFEAHKKERLEKMFAAQDQNKDGRLARTESHMPSAWFERADQNHDGVLTLAELTDARKNVARDHEGKPRHDGKRHGAGLDENGDGKVDRAELSQAAARQMTRLDTNADGSLTIDEFGAERGHGHGRRHHDVPGHDAAPKNAPAPKAG